MAKKAEAPHGAWKVAYADFVTAMMALFMVLWISAQDEQIVIAASRYFQNPFSTAADKSGGILLVNRKTARHESQDSILAKSTSDVDRGRRVDIAFLNSVAAEFYRLLHLDKNLTEQPIDIEVTSDGLRLTLFDRANRPLFASDTTDFTEWGKFVMQNLAWIVDRHKFHVTIDGHTRAEMPFVKLDYSAWELSADRANAARRRLVHFAVAPTLIERVTGYADSQPLPGKPANAESNQRLTLSLTLAGKAHFKDGQIVETPTAAKQPKASTPTTP